MTKEVLVDRSMEEVVEGQAILVDTVKEDMVDNMVVKEDPTLMAADQEVVEL